LFSMEVSDPRNTRKTICLKLNLKIRGVDFVANLIVLDSMDIHDILGMDWLSKHKVPIDHVEKSIKLTTPDGKELSISQSL
jgi:predicted aspartyl protease